MSGVFDYLESLDGDPKLIGIIGGWRGLKNGWTRDISRDIIEKHINLGGQEILCDFGGDFSRGELVDCCVDSIVNLKLDGLIVAGNLVSQLNTALLAEACAAANLPTRIVGVPVSM